MPLLCPWGRENRDFSKSPPIPVEKEYILWKLKQVDVHVKNWCSEHKLSRNTYNNWNRIIQKGGKIQYTTGRPKLLGEKELKQLSDLCVEKRNNGSSLSFDKATEKIGELAEEKSNNCGKIMIQPMCKKTVIKYLDEADLSIKNAQNKTSARMQAENDVFSAVSTSLMWHYAFHYVNNSSLVLNFDATQYCIGAKTDEPTEVVVSMKNENENVGNVKPLSILNKNSDLCYFIKYFCICTLAGLICPQLVFVIADSSLNDDDCFTFKVDELSTSNDPYAYGYICVCKTRCGNEKLFMFLNEQVIIPFINLLRQKHNTTGNTNAFVTCDGEADQIYPYFNDNMKKLCDDNNIIVGKLAASTTAVSQACDAYKMFSATKARCKGMLEDEVNAMVSLKSNIQKMITQYETDSKRTFNAADKRRLVPGVIKCVLAITKSLNRSIVINSFKTIGISNNCVVNHAQIFKQFNVKFTTEEFLDFQCRLENGLKAFRKYGRMNDNEMMKYDVIFNRMDHDDPPNRDQLALYRERCVIITHKATVERFENKKLQKEIRAVEIISARENREDKKKNAVLKQQETAAIKVLEVERKKVEAEKKKADTERKKNEREKEVANNKRKREEIREGKKKKIVKICHCDIDADSDEAFDCLMVLCTNEDKCKSGQWFHYECIEHDDKWVPPDDWMCAKCAANKKKNG